MGERARMIEESVIREVIERTDIVRLVGEYVPLKRRSGRFWGCCPFHKEKTASFSVNPERGAYYCFGCHKGGHAVNFLMEMEGCSFPEAVEQLADRLGVEVRRTEGVREESRATKRAREQSYYAVNRAAQAFFVRSFEGSLGSACRDYAKRRRLSEDSVKAFGLGYAPESWDGVVEFLKASGVSLEDARALGIVASRESGGYYARFRNRFMFPVMNVRGEVVAFSGRTLDQNETAKYINSPESPIYTKGEHLFGLYQAKDHIRREKCAILVEGNVDAVMMHAHGFCHTVASLGTALTAKQAGLLFRHTRVVYVMYDGDEAGQNAMMKALPLLLAHEFEGLYAVELPPDPHDPDEYLKVYGVDGMSELISHAKPLGMWCVERKCRQILSYPPELRKKAFGELGELLLEFPDKFAQRHYLEESARFLGNVDVGRLAAEVGVSADFPRAQTTVSSSEVGMPARLNAIECIAVQMVLMSEGRYESFWDQRCIDLIQSSGLRTLLQEYDALEDKSEYGVETGLSEGSLRLYHQLVCGRFDVPREESDAEVWYQGALSSLLCDWAKREHVQVAYEIAHCVEHQELEMLDSLLERDKALLDLMEKSYRERGLKKMKRA